MVLAIYGTPLQRKRVGDCWVILELNIGVGWETDQAVINLLRILNTLSWIRPGDLYSLVDPYTRDPHAAWWRLKGVYDALELLILSGDATLVMIFCQRILEALVPGEILTSG
jgi:hypothetical protein